MKTIIEKGKKFYLSLGNQQQQPPHHQMEKDSEVIDGVTLGGEKKAFGIKSYLHQFYLSPTAEEIEASGAWYLLPPPPRQRTGVYICRFFSLLGLLLLVGGAAAIIYAYSYQRDPNDVELSIMKIAISQDEEGNFYIPQERFNEMLKDPMRTWKMAGFCIFAGGACLMALSLLVPTCAQMIGTKRLAAFVSEDNTPNEAPIRIFPTAPSKFKVIPAKMTPGHRISPTSGPVPVMEQISQVQPQKQQQQQQQISHSSSNEHLITDTEDVHAPLMHNIQ